MLGFLIDNIFVLFDGRVFQQTMVGYELWIVIRYLLICFYIPMMQTSFKCISRIKIEFFLVIIYISSIQMSIKLLRILLILKSWDLPWPSPWSRHWRKIKAKLYVKRDYFNIPIVNFPYISSNIQAPQAHWVYISQLIHYSRSCAQYCDFLDRAQLLTQMLLKQGYDAPIYGLHHNLVDSYKICIFQMTLDLLLFM